MKKNKDKIYIHLTTWSDDGLREVKLPVEISNNNISLSLPSSDSKVMYFAKGLRNGWVYVNESVDQIFNKITEIKNK